MATVESNTARSRGPVEPDESTALDPYAMPVCVPTSALTHDGFRAWATSDSFPQFGRISFIDRTLVIEMSPEELETHNKLKTEIGSRVHLLGEDLDLGTYYSDGTLVTNESAELSTEPDGTFVTWASFRNGRVRLVPRKDEIGQYTELMGSPDWVLEVVSRSSYTKDTKLLREAYHRANVKEYWLVNALGDEIDFQILYHRRSGYARATPRDGWLRSRVFGSSFHLTRRRNRLGYWRYTLEIKQ